MRPFGVAIDVTTELWMGSCPALVCRSVNVAAILDAECRKCGSVRQFYLSRSGDSRWPSASTCHWGT